MPELSWLPPIEDWRERLRAVVADPATAWEKAIALANTRLDFVRTNALDEMLRRAIGDAPPAGLATKPVRLAILGSSTTAHLHAAIRVAGLRRGIHLTITETDYGQYWQELIDPASALHAFKPTAVLFALDAWHLSGGVHGGMSARDAAGALESVLLRLRECWRLARDAFHCPIMQQTALPVFPTVLVPLHSGFDWLKMSRLQRGQDRTIDQNGDAPWHTGAARDQAGSFERQQHLMN